LGCKEKRGGQRNKIKDESKIVLKSCAGVLWSIFFSPFSLDHIHVMKFVLHKQIYNESPTKIGLPLSKL